MTAMKVMNDFEKPPKSGAMIHPELGRRPV